MVSMTKIVYQHMHLDRDGGDKGEKYYFYLILNRCLKGMRLTERERNRRTTMAWHMFCTMPDGTINSRARHAMDTAFGPTLPVRSRRNVVAA